MKNNIVINDNEILKANAYRNVNGVNKNMKDIITQNIIDDYKINGIKDVELNLFAGNYYNEKGDAIKNWEKGEILKVNDIVKIETKGNKSLFYSRENKPIYFRVVSRYASYEGQPLFTIKCQEINGGM
jgi:hypothetical protein